MTDEDDVGVLDRDDHHPQPRHKSDDKVDPWALSAAGVRLLGPLVWGDNRGRCRVGDDETFVTEALGRKMVHARPLPPRPHPEERVGVPETRHPVDAGLRLVCTGDHVGCGSRLQ